MKPFTLVLLPAIILCTACSTKKIDAETVYTGVNHTFVRKAQIYQTSGDYLHNLPVQFADGNITSYPDPADITPESAPIPVEGGYLLDRRGVTPQTVFTTYTYTQYAALTAAPAISALKTAIIPGARVTRIVTLPISATQAAADTAAVNRLIRTGLPDCTTTFTLPSISL